MTSDCSLLRNVPGECALCVKPLPPRRRRWCSDKCSREFVANHRYSKARATCKRRARVRTPKGIPTLYTCNRCGTSHEYVEVNHIEPCRGRHGAWGCWHHQSNLECLCRPCHLAVTAEQRMSIGDSNGR